ncbi:MAG: hypothetical protein ACK4UN_00420 [Limisphaerales bacterium]
MRQFYPEDYTRFNPDKPALRRTLHLLTSRQGSYSGHRFWAAGPGKPGIGRLTSANALGKPDIGHRTSPAALRKADIGRLTSTDTLGKLGIGHLTSADVLGKTDIDRLI